MAVKIRLRRGGRKASPFYSIVVCDSRTARDGKFIEKLGFYNPTTIPAQIHLNAEAAIKWLENGAQPTNTTRNILRNAGVTLRHALRKQGKSDETAQAIFDKWYTAKMSSSKRNFVLVDVTGKPVAGQPEIKKEVKADLKVAKAKPVAEEVVEEVVVAAEETAAEVTETVAEVTETAAEAVEAPATEEAAAPEAEA